MVLHHHPVISVLALSFSAWTSWASPFPSNNVIRQSVTLSEQSSCNDLETYQTQNNVKLQTNMWDLCDASDYLSNWWNGHYGDTNFAADFADPFGISQSFSCAGPFSSPCARPDCTTLQQPDQPGTGPAYEVMVSLANINNFLAAARSSLELADGRWSSLQVAIQQKFWPNHPTDQLGLKEILGAMSAITGMGLSIAGAIPEAAAGFGGATAGLIGGMVGAYTGSLTDTDHSLDYLASMEEATDAWYQGALNTIDTLNSDLMSIGHHVFPDGSIADVQPLLQEGAWLDYRNIPVLNTDQSLPQVSTTALNQLTYNMLLGQLINYAWNQQAVYIVKYDMTQDEFDNFVSVSGNNDGRLKLYYGGSAFFYQSIYMNGDFPTAQDPPGWGDVEGEFNGALTPQGILQSSADAFHASGYGHVFDAWPDTDPETLLAVGPTVPGFFNVPVCVPPAENVPDINSLNNWLNVDGNYYVDGGPYTSSWCMCANVQDGNGKVFTGQFPPSWTQAMYGNCNPSGVDPIGPTDRI